MSKREAPGEPGDPRLKIQLDGTTLHRLAMLVRPRSGQPVSRLELLNVLHLLECIVLADSVRVWRYEQDRVQDEADVLTGLLEELRAEDGAALLDQPQLPEELELKCAINAAEDLFFQLGQSFADPECPEISGVDSRAGRPMHVVYGTGTFWMEMAESKAGDERIVEEAQARVADSKTAFVFAYGLALCDPVRESILRCYRAGGPWPERHWRRLEVLFRTLYNQHLADPVDIMYAPAPARALSMERIHCLSLIKLREALLPVIEKAHPKYLSDMPWLRGYVCDGKAAVPLLGLAVLLRAASEPEGVVERVAKVRELPGLADLRRKLATLERAYREGEATGLRTIQRECQNISRAITLRLGLPEMEGTPHIRISPWSWTGFAQSLLENGPELTDWLEFRRAAGSERVAFLSNLVARCASIGSLEHSVGDLLGRG